MPERSPAASVPWSERLKTLLPAAWTSLEAVSAAQSITSASELAAGHYRASEVGSGRSSQHIANRRDAQAAAATTRTRMAQTQPTDLGNATLQPLNDGRGDPSHPSSVRRLHLMNIECLERCANAQMGAPEPPRRTPDARGPHAIPVEIRRTAKLSGEHAQRAS